MKKMVMALFLLVAIGATAQKLGKRFGKEMKAEMTAEQLATLHTKKMTLTLDLTEGQQRQIMEINLAKAVEMKTKRAEIKAKKESGDWQKPTADERFEIENARLDRQIAHHQQMKEVLTEDQYKTWKKITLGKRMKGKKKMQEKGRRG